MPGVTGVSGLSVIPFGRQTYFDFDLSLITFTAGMAKREGNGPFAAAPIIQGMWDGTGTPDVVSFARGNQLGNPTDVLYANFDPYQGSAVMWWTPEITRDAAQPDEYLWRVATTYWMRYEHDNSRLVLNVGGTSNVNLATVAGTTYFIVARWDTKKTLDGTNYICISINDVHTFGLTMPPVLDTPTALGYLGSSNGVGYPANAILEGVTFYRRVLTDGDGYGDSIGIDDEIADIYAAGAGEDPCVVTGGSWDIPFCVPTDSQVGALVTGTGEAWSHPLSGGSIEQHPLADDGYYGGYPYAVVHNGTSTYVDCGSAAGIDNLPNGATLTIDFWVRLDADPTADYGALVHKGNQGADGYLLVYDKPNNRYYFDVELATANAQAYCEAVAPDGKWHLVTAYYADGTKTARVAFDGRWGVAGVGVGAYQVDAARNLMFGRAVTASTWFFQGAQGYIEFSNNDRHGGAAGTDFVSPRVPYDDGNTIESWHANDGTGATLTATVVSPAQDGTITDGTWEEQWEPDTSPVIPCSLEFDGTNDGIDFGSGVNIDNLPNADCTIDVWARVPPGSNPYIISKANAAGTAGWYVRINGGTVEVKINHATDCDLSYAGDLDDDVWHEYTVDWDFGTLTGRLLVDGVEQDTSTAVGAYIVDAAEDCIVNGIGAVGTNDDEMAIGPIRLSNVQRVTSTYFCPPARTNWPANDANAHLITRMNDGAGATVTDYSGNAYHGTVTFGTMTQWHNTPDQEVDAPGKRRYPWGYGFGSDAANDGIEQIITGLTPGDGYVVSVPVGYDPDGRAEPELGVWDNVGGAWIVQFIGPRLQGVHTGANNSPTLIDVGARWPQSLVGSPVYNITDGSAGTITAISGDGTTITAALAGGVDNDWDTNDEYMIQPGDEWAWVETFGFTLPALCTSIQFRVRNLVAEGVIYVHQAEVIENLLANGDHESLQGVNPELITGWANVNLDPGDTQASSGGGNVIHSGVEALQWNVGASAEYQNVIYNLPLGDFATMGIWSYGDGAASFRIGARSVSQAVVHSTLVGQNVYTGTIAAWTHAAGVFRSTVTAGNVYWRIYASSGAVGARYSDDVYLFECDAVSLTVTPANAANSLESGGIRVDGRDTCTQAILAGVNDTSGHIRWRIRPRHADGDYRDFEESATPWMLWLSAPILNYITVDLSAANTIRLEIFVGGGATNGTVVAPGLVADTEYLFEIIYNATQIRLLIDGVTQITLNPAGGIDFAGDAPQNADWGHRPGGDNQMDAVFLNP